MRVMRCSLIWVFENVKGTLDSLKHYIAFFLPGVGVVFLSKFSSGSFDLLL